MKKLIIYFLAGVISIAFTVPAFAQSTSTSSSSTTTTTPAAPEKSGDVKVENGKVEVQAKHEIRKK